MSYEIPFDMTTYISESIHEVYKTLFEALVLVVLVVFLSLQSWRATLIPVVAVPISLIGTFGFMLIFGFSLNILTLLGLILAIGIVVDDAIVVVENVEHLMETENSRPMKQRKSNERFGKCFDCNLVGALCRICSGKFLEWYHRTIIPPVHYHYRCVCVAFYGCGFNP